MPRLLPWLLDAKERPGEASLLLVGDVDFDAKPGQVVENARPTKSGERTGQRTKWDPLPGTKTEIQAVRAPSRNTQADGKLSGTPPAADASQKAVCELAPKYSILHLATHGFFADPKVRSAFTVESKATPNHGFGGDLFGQRGVAGFHPGLLSGLVLAGTNRPTESGQADGILTALEVAELDLARVDLAVLSACETGLGRVAGGEGVLGLQRFGRRHKTTVTSVWSVR